MRPRDGNHERLVRQVLKHILERVADDERRKIMVEQAATFATLYLPARRVSGIVQEVLGRNRHMLNPLRDFPYLRAGYRKGKAEGMAKGEAKGIAKGKAKGKAEGEVKGMAKSLLVLLKGRNLEVSPALRKKILDCTNKSKLSRWLQASVTAKSTAEVVEAR